MKELKKLIDVKSIMTIIMTSGVLYGFIKRIISADQYITLTTMIFMFYFTKKPKQGSDE